MTKAEAKELLIDYHFQTSEDNYVGSIKHMIIDAYLDDPNRSIKFDDEITCSNCGSIDLINNGSELICNTCGKVKDETVHCPKCGSINWGIEIVSNYGSHYCLDCKTVF